MKKDRQASIDVPRLAQRIGAIADVDAVPLGKVEAIVVEIEKRKSECRLCKKPYFRRKFRAAKKGFCTDKHRAAWHRGEREVPAA